MLVVNFCNCNGEQDRFCPRSCHDAGSKKISSAVAVYRLVSALNESRAVSLLERGKKFGHAAWIPCNTAVCISQPCVPKLSDRIPIAAVHSTADGSLSHRSVLPRSKDSNAA